MKTGDKFGDVVAEILEECHKNNTDRKTISIQDINSNVKLEITMIFKIVYEDE